MEEQVKLPDLGEGVDSATVVSILVSEGDEIEKDQGVLEMETDKAVAEMPSPKAGRIKQIHVKKNQTVTVGDLLFTLEVGGAGEGEAGEQAPAKAEQKKGAEGEEEEEEAEEKKTDEEEAEKRRTDKQTREQEAGKAERPAAKRREATGSEAEQRVEAAGTKAAVEREEEQREEAEREVRPADHPGRQAGSDVPAAPTTRRLAHELGVDLTRVDGTGDGGWITPTDVKRAAHKLAQTAAPPEGRERDDWGIIRRERMPQIRQTIARKMRESKDTAAHITHFDDADVTELDALRQRENERSEDARLSLLPFVVHAVLAALKDHPRVNASLDLEAGEILYKEYYNIGIAVATDRGLIVPVLRNVESLSIYESAQAIGELVEKVRSGDFEVQDLRGGTFSVSNLGVIGGRYATPIINIPESAILLLGQARRMPVEYEGEIALRLMLPLSLTYDHRLIDGAEAQYFLNSVRAYLQSPEGLLTR